MPMKILLFKRGGYQLRRISLAGVAVAYRVFRQPLFRPYYRDPNLFPEDELPYWTDTVHTDTDGRFRVAFPAEKKGTKSSWGSVLQVHFSATDPTGETRQQQTFLPINAYRYTIRSRMGVANTAAANRILVLEHGPFLALDVQIAQVLTRRCKARTP